MFFRLRLDGHFGSPFCLIPFDVSCAAIFLLLRSAVCRLGLVFLLPLASDRHSVLGSPPAGL